MLISFLFCGFVNPKHIDKTKDTVVSEISIVSVEDQQESNIYFPTYQELSSLDLTQPSGLTTTQLRKGLLKELKPYALYYIQMEKEYGVNAVFLASKDALESGWGKYANNNNLSGWGNYRDFDSKRECIEEVSLYIYLWYLTEPHDATTCTDECNEYRNVYNKCTIGQYYNGTTIADVNIYYNGRAVWEQSVIDIMAGVYERIQNDES